MQEIASSSAERLRLALEECEKPGCGDGLFPLDAEMELKTKE